MGYWGKVVGGVAGLFMGGPFGAMVGAALGHAADSGQIGQFPFGPGGFLPPGFGARLIGNRDQVFAVAAVVLSAKLAKSDGPVNRAEIDAFRRHFRVPPEAAADIGRLFDRARDTAEGYERYASELGRAFADNRGVLEDVLAALFAIARADHPLTRGEEAFLRATHRLLGLDDAAWARASGAAPRRNADEADPYTVLGLSRSASNEDVRSTWKRLMRENHPDSLASRGVPAEFIARASDKVARINAAWDRVKRERGL
jgi:DnaJ like chaperone protein